MYCQECGTKVTDEAKFCHNCGGKVPLPDEKIRDQSKRVFTVRTALKEYFQGAIGEAKFREAIRKGQIPHIRIGTRIILREDALNVWAIEQEQFSVTKSKNPYRLAK